MEEKKSRRWEGHQNKMSGDARRLACGCVSRILLSLRVLMTNVTIRHWSRLRVKFKFSNDHPLDFFPMKDPRGKKSLISCNYKNAISLVWTITT